MRKNAIDIFISKDKIARFWFVAFVIVLALAIWDRQSLIHKLTQKPVFFAVDGADTFYISSLADFESAKTVHDDITRMAAECLFNRNPKGSDFPERMKRLFNANIYQTALKWMEKNAAVFQEENIHQKIEVGPVTILQTTQNVVLTSVKGQVIRNGMFEDKPYTDVFEVEILFKCILNKDMRSNGRYPIIIESFEPHVLASKGGNRK